MNKTEYSLLCSFSERLNSCEDREQIHKTKIHITTRAFWCRQDVESSHPPLNVVFFKLVYLNTQAVRVIFRVPPRGWSSRERLGVLVSLQASHQSDIWQSLLPMAMNSSEQRAQAWFQTALMLRGRPFCFHQVYSIIQMLGAAVSSAKSLVTEEGIKKEKYMFTGRAAQVSMTKKSMYWKEEPLPPLCAYARYRI